MNQYDEMNLKKIDTITEDNGKVYIHITDAKPIKMHGTRFLLFKHRGNFQFGAAPSNEVKSTALAMTSIVGINFKESLV
jgi:hypothetical protein